VLWRVRRTRTGLGVAGSQLNSTPAAKYCSCMRWRNSAGEYGVDWPQSTAPGVKPANTPVSLRFLDRNKRDRQVAPQVF